MNIVFFYSRVVSYTEGMLDALAKINEQNSIDVVYWHNKSQHCLTENSGINYHRRSQFNRHTLLELLNKLKPEILYISGWMDKDYLYATQRYKLLNRKVKVVCGIDDQWKNTLKQNFGRIVFAFWFRHLFDYMWVAGKPQYHYARKMGYDSSRIISNLYSANSKFYCKKAPAFKRIVYLGRFSVEKGIPNLLNAYRLLDEKSKSEWPLVLIGDGPLKQEILDNLPSGATVLPFMQDHALMEELNKGGVLCLPSNLFEMWGVVIHEAAILGYPLLVSNICGAVSEFLINGYNGYSFDPNSESDLLSKLKKITALSDSQFADYSERSHRLGCRITSEHSAYSLMSVLHAERD